MFITALFIIASTWKQPRCPSTDEWIRKLWYIYTMEYYYNLEDDIEANFIKSVEDTKAKEIVNTHERL